MGPGAQRTLPFQILAPPQLEARSRISTLKAMGMGSNQALRQLHACSASSLEDTLIWTITPNAWKHQPQEPLTGYWIGCVFPVS